ncbi:uncharacterized protein LOC130825468 [Amaranthus tricolor]|uniref:uncharacterized protein LOC130825468 n=1 Tax=Amaranthus tricolor TaxID=29722 RepID=UPI002584EAD8|nr:uncharacterized protein LOC130825468 [Amaranthus tricolor]
MMNANSQVSDKKHRLIATKLVSTLKLLVDWKSYQQLGINPRARVAILVDPAWDAAEKGEWSKKISEEREVVSLLLNLDKLTVNSPSIPELPEKLSLSKLEYVFGFIQPTYRRNQEPPKLIQGSLGDGDLTVCYRNYITFRTSPEENIVGSSNPQPQASKAESEDISNAL